MQLSKIGPGFGMICTTPLEKYLTTSSNVLEESMFTTLPLITDILQFWLIHILNPLKLSHCLVSMLASNSEANQAMCMNTFLKISWSHKYLWWNKCWEEKHTFSFIMGKMTLLSKHLAHSNGLKECTMTKCKNSGILLLI